MSKLKEDLRWLVSITLCCFFGGIISDRFRQSPLGLTYQLPAARLAKSKIYRKIRMIQVDELQSLLSKDQAVLLDVRPKIFWQLGHIPKAEVLQKYEFETDYRSLQERLTRASEDGTPIIVYCSSKECPDASTVASELSTKGLRNLIVFEAGWEGWIAAGNEIKTDL